MNVEDEVHNFPDPSGDLIQRHCREARELIARAGTRDEAMNVKRELCSRLATTCDSNLVLQATTAYINDLIDRTWKSP